MLSGSVTRKVQNGYATAVKHYRKAELALGHNFSTPPTAQEVVFLVTYLLGEDLKPETIRSYLSGIRFYLLSKGVPSPSKLPLLAEQLLQGKAKLSRDALKAASKGERRVITIDIMLLIGHSIAVKTWSTYEKALFWSVSCCAF